MSLFRNKKRTEFYNDLKKVDFGRIKVDENNFDIKGVLEQIKKETEKISKAIENWRKNKTHKDTDGYGTYLKSKSQKHLNGLKNACEEIEKIKNTKEITINTLLKLILTLQSELKSAATAKFSLFTFGAVLDDRKNKKRLAEISRDIGYLQTKIVNAKEKIEEKAKKSKIVIGSHRKPKDDEKKDPKKDPGIFKGLPNEENYCYLNTALQQLYTMEYFKNKILNFDTNGLDTTNEDNKKLIAVKKIFEHLKNKKNLTNQELNDLRKDLGHESIQQDSGEQMLKIRDACTKAFKNKKSKSTDNNIENIETLTGFSATDPSIPIETSIEEFLKETKDVGRFIYLKIKNDKLFQVIIPNRPNKRNISTNIQEKMTFRNVGNNIFIVNNFKDKNPRELKTFNCELVSVTIHRGKTNSGHYFVYKKNGSSWVKINDNIITTHKWSEIKDDINHNSTVLTYKLLN